MPNWTCNTWSIEGDDAVLDTVRAALRGKLFDFNRIIPTPKELERSQSPLEVVPTQEEADEINASWREKAIKFNWPDQDPEIIVAITEEERDRRIAKHGAVDWYGFRNKRWSTKWPGSELEILCNEPERLVIRFNTAWSPPLAIVDHIESLGLQVYGGGIYESGSEFELIGSDESAFLERFAVIQTTEADGDYTWSYRSISWIGKPQPVTA